MVTKVRKSLFIKKTFHLENSVLQIKPSLGLIAISDMEKE